LAAVNVSDEGSVVQIIADAVARRGVANAADDVRGQRVGANRGVSS
jgi:hypothetical protein